VNWSMHLKELVTPNGAGRYDEVVMSETPQPAIRCVHCLLETDATTKDHVFPSSWYPDSTPETVQRWTVPSCTDCNKFLGKLETDLLVRLALCLDPASAAAAGISSKALRSLGLDVDDLAPKEKEHRDKRRAKIKAELFPRAEGSETPGAIPGLSRPVGEGKQFALPIPWAALSIIAEKIARGCEFKVKDRYIDSPYAIRTFIADPEEVSPQFLSHRRLIDFGPGCQVLRVFCAEDHNIVRYRILVWGTLCFHVLIDTEEYFLELDPQLKRAEGILPNEGKMSVPPYLREMK